MSQASRRQLICTLYNNGITDTDQLIACSGCSRATVFRTVARIRNNQTMVHGPVSGRPKVIDETDRRRIAQWLRFNKHLSASEIATRLRAYGTYASERVVRDELKSMGYVCSRPPRGPMIKAEHKANRVQWCLQQEQDQMNWNKVVFSDECQICLHRNTLKIWRERDSPVKTPVPSQSPRVGVWSAFSAKRSVSHGIL